MKSANISSATGRLPASAAPAAAPMIAHSEIGVSITRPRRTGGTGRAVDQIPPIASGPPDVPIAAETSSPSTMTRWRRAPFPDGSLIDRVAHRHLCHCAAPVAQYEIVDVGQDVAPARAAAQRAWPFATARSIERQHFGIDRIELRDASGSLSPRSRVRGSSSGSRGLADAVDFALGAIALRIAFEVAEEARDRPRSRRALAAAGPSRSPDASFRTPRRSRRRHRASTVMPKPRRGWRCPCAPTAYSTPVCSE